MAILIVLLIGLNSFLLATNSANVNSTKDSTNISAGINHGPYLVNMTDSSVQIVWTTSVPCLSWVEIAPDDGSHFYASERKKYFDSPYGQKRIGKFHCIKVDGLKPGTKYRYRIFSTEVLYSKYPQYHYGKSPPQPHENQQPLCRLLRNRSHLSQRLSDAKYIKNSIISPLAVYKNSP